MAKSTASREGSMTWSFARIEILISGARCLNFKIAGMIQKLDMAKLADIVTCVLLSRSISITARRIDTRLSQIAL
ncbi:hypothetical protein D9M69_639050 [compost metagenome]